MENREPGILGIAGPRGPEADPADETVLGVLEDDRLRATVTTTGDEVVVTLEGELDETAAPVVDELLDAVGRWHGRAERRRAGQGGDPRPEVAPGASLLLDTRRIELDPASRRMLAVHRDRWRREHGPCEALTGGSDQGSKR